MSLSPTTRHACYTERAGRHVTSVSVHACRCMRIAVSMVYFVRRSCRLVTEVPEPGGCQESAGRRFGGRQRPRACPRMYVRRHQ
jgi:hypothetical protein